MNTTIPVALIERQQWVTWNYVNGTKVPFSARNGKHASSTDPRTWSSYELAQRSQVDRQHAGIGYVFSKDDPYTGIDLDDCVADDGTIEEWALIIVRSFDSYTEISPSGHGLKIWIEGTIPKSVKTAQVEIYNERRYFTVTGRHLAGTPNIIRAAQANLATLYEQLKPLSTPVEQTFTTLTLDDSYLRAWADRIIDSTIVRMRDARSGERHNVRLAMGRLLGGLIKHGLMTDDRAERLLYDANVPDENHANERQAIKDGIANGKSDPLPSPPPPAQPVMDTDGYACCPDHKQRLMRGKRRGWYCSIPDRTTPSGWCNFWWEGDGYIEPRTPIKTTKHNTEYVTAAWNPSIISAAELYRKEFPNLVWTVDGLIPEGLCILAGKPKSKKSWLSLAVAVAVAYGGKAFGYYDVTQGRVLYLDLESNQRRMRSRLRSIIGDRIAWPSNFDIVTEWKRGDEGIALLDNYCEAHPDTRLIVIDIWARFRPMRDPKADAYEQDYNALQALNAWAEARRITVIVIHHTRKMKSDDVFEEISGTTGIVGAVATALILTRSPDVPDEQLLHMTGRDLIVDEPIALKWDNYTCQHIYVATGAEASSSADRRRILNAMDEDQEYQVKEIAQMIGKTSMRSLDNQLRRLMDDKLIERTGRGKYAKIVNSGGDGGDDGNSGDGRDSGEYHYVNPSPLNLYKGSGEGFDASGQSKQPSPPSPLHYTERGNNNPIRSTLLAHLDLADYTMLTNWLRSDDEYSQRRAQDMCKELSLDYEEAKREI